MSVFPIIPIWLMLIICIVFIVFIFKYNNKNIIQIIIIILLFLINLRVMIPAEGVESVSTNLDVLFVIDNTISMSALDYNGNNTRLSGVKADCNYIIDELSGSRFSVIVFGNDGKIATPYTKDINITKEAIDILIPISELYAKGTSLNAPIETMKYSYNYSKKSDRKKILFFISDGEITNETPLGDYSNFSKYVKDGAVLGYGTKTGGYMKSDPNYSSEEYIMDYENYNRVKAVSKIDENNLKKIASDIKIDYIKMNKTSDINKKIRTIKNSSTRTLESDDKKSYDDTYYWLVFPLLVCVAIEFNNFRRKVI